MPYGSRGEPAPAERSSVHVAAATVLLSWRSAPLAFAGMLLATAASGGVAPAAAWTGKLLIDELTAPRGTPVAKHAYELAMTGALLGALGLLLGYLAGYLSASTQRRIVVYAENELYGSTSRMVGLRNFEDSRFHDRLKLAVQAVDFGPADVTSFLVDLVRRSVAMAAFAGVLFTIWPAMTLILLVAAMPALVGQLVMARQHVGATSASAEADRRRFYYRSLLTDLRAAKEMQVFGLGTHFRRRMIDALWLVSSAELRQQRRATVAESVFALVNGLISAVGAFVAVRGVLDGRLTVGDLTIFVAAVAAAQGMFGSLVVQLGAASRATGLMRNYFAICDLPAELESGTGTVPPLRVGIELRNVWFRYVQHGPWVLRGMNLTIPAGRSLGLVGVNGAGKSTLVKLLLRLYDVDRGQILWDGLDIRSLDLQQLRRRIGTCFQDFVPYELTAHENIALGDLAQFEDRHAVSSAADRAGIGATLQALPLGLDTLLSRQFSDERQQEGVTLSGGQWQRMGLARALMRTEADLLLLDEPSTGLDPFAERQVQEAVQAHRRDRTSVLVSHRLNGMRAADRIAVLVDGRVSESGSHSELMAGRGTYFGLFTAQAEGYEVAHPEPCA